ncbi:MAG TPA: Asp-tRNA(Asn)/Glu-tRNA(Gln) amidotransferase GatCAB subunit A [Clostridiales bacterium]|nr:MAG: aspartyl/glutamyl-tRNA amidotransferase subunit A [Clostridiales bacterium GWD2_32_19]HCC08251.1 Asp-tRNA(Asn)/Glu-tRNA(Gln) amidotransferase GatCAB subunit A [Clostridiales bacterium]
MELHDKTVHELCDMLDNNETTSVELTKACFNRIKDVEDKVQAFITITEDAALKQAEETDKKRKNGEVLGILHGIPMAIKDNMCTEGILTTCGSKMLSNFVPPYTSTAVNKLNTAGCILLGKTNMDEFAMGSSTENSYFKKTKNPWDLNRVPGGSSGGSAAAVAACEAPFSLGSDTGGSIRQPAHYCGVVGMKPTYGSVSRYGLVAFASSLDQIGPFTKDVHDMALILSTITGHDPKDSTSYPREYPDFTKALNQDVRGMKIALPKEFFGKGINEEVKSAVMNVAKKYESMGAKVEEVSMPMSDYALPVYYLIACAEASSNLARYDGIRFGYRAQDVESLDDLYKKTRSEGFGDEVKRRIILGTYALSSGYYDAYYKKAQQVRTLIKKEFDDVYKNYDMILTPTGPTVAFEFGQNSDNPLEMYMNDICTVPINIAGVPAMSMNCGFDSKGMPIGMQLVGKHFDEFNILKLAHAMEKELGLNNKSKL